MILFVLKLSLFRLLGLLQLAQNKCPEFMKVSPLLPQTGAFVPEGLHASAMLKIRNSAVNNETNFNC
jgi:hypothetical protein